MDALVAGATSQYVDDSGKTRMLNFAKENLSLMVSPIPPLNLPLADKRVNEASIDVAKRFIASKGLKIDSQEGTEEEIWGLWLEPSSETSLYYAYIPVANTKPLKDVPYTDATKTDPIRTEPEKMSELRRYQHDRKVADFLRRYTLYAYSLDPEGFSDKSFVVVPNHKYEIESLNKRLFVEGNNVMFKGKRLIVQSEKIRDQLLDYLRVATLNDKEGVLQTKSVRSLDVYYQSISDFRPAQNQLVFMSREAVRRWRNDAANAGAAGLVQDDLQPDTREPYYYRNIRYNDGALMIVQNVDGGELQRAVAVSAAWMNQGERINKGYKAPLPDDIDNYSYEIYYTNGSRETHTVKKGDSHAPVLAYDEKKGYAAMLFI